MCQNLVQPWLSIFPGCDGRIDASHKGRCDNRPADLRDAALIFFIQDSNMFHDGTMGDKHVGFWVKPREFDYSTVNRCLMRESLSGILARLDEAYHSNKNVK